MLGDYRVGDGDTSSFDNKGMRFVVEGQGIMPGRLERRYGENR
jgi:hypothetical protein